MAAQFAYTDPGAMDRQISILDPGDPELARNSDGSFPPPSVFLTGISAKIEALSSNEQYKAQQAIGVITHRVTILYRAGLLNRMQIDFRGRIFQIRGVRDPDEKQVELRIDCEELNQGQ
jgi:SPP1 family predicted phage head-tail adaptor